MFELDTETSAFLREFQDQPEDVRRIFIYAICQTMDQAGLLQFMGAFSSPGVGVTLIYKNPDTGEMFEIVKPRMSKEEELAIQAHIGELLRDEARTEA